MLVEGTRVVVEAPPGAGKTTRLPLALLDQPWAKGKILVLEPRRVAARAAASRMAHLLGEPVGRTVGYRVREDRKVGPETHIEVVTEGILTRQLQRDPELSGISAVIFDEFHERSLSSDLGLALCLDMSELREDLRLVVMSATLDGDAVASLMGGVPRVVSEGRSHPVEVVYRPDASPTAAVREALALGSGDVLVFLPGEREIRRLERDLLQARIGARVAPLYGALPAAEQDEALRHRPGERKVVLATTIAQTSLTIEGVDVVVDVGHARSARYDPGTGMTKLETRRVSQASARQRAGRAGRLGPGVCIRLWGSSDALEAFDPPEIAVADLAPLALELATWGAPPDELSWLDPPAVDALDRAAALLTDLGAIDENGRLTPHGARMAELGVHPRLGHLLLASRTTAACEVAAILDEGDVLSAPPELRQADLDVRIDVVRGGRPPSGMSIRRGALQRVRRSAARWARMIDARADDVATGALVALAYPDRVAARRRTGRYVMSNGKGARLRETDPVGTEPFLAIAATDGRSDDSNIQLAAGLDRSDITEAFELRVVDFVGWDDALGEVVARRDHLHGSVVVRSEPLVGADPAPGLIEGVRARGLDSLPWDATSLALRDRIRFLHAEFGEPWPDLTDSVLLDDLDEWLLPHLTGTRRWNELRRLDLAAILRSRLSWESQQQLDTHAPERLTVPSGARYRVDYSGERPVWAVKLQELFGVQQTPAVAGGRVVVLVHLLSPAGRPLQVTDDLAGFWSGSYAQVRAEMRGRYPKHHWPAPDELG